MRLNWSPRWSQQYAVWTQLMKCLVILDHGAWLSSLTNYDLLLQKRKIHPQFPSKRINRMECLLQLLSQKVTWKWLLKENLSPKRRRRTWRLFLASKSFLSLLQSFSVRLRVDTYFWLNSTIVGKVLAKGGKGIWTACFQSVYLNIFHWGASVSDWYANIL